MTSTARRESSAVRELLERGGALEGLVVIEIAHQYVRHGGEALRRPYGIILIPIECSSLDVAAAPSMV